MKLTAKSMILCSIILWVLGNPFAVTQEQFQIEQLLPQDVAIIANFNHLGDQVKTFQQSQLFKILSALHKIDKPKEVPMEEALEKIWDQPFLHLIENKVVLGIIPPQQPQASPVVIVIVIGDEHLSEHLSAFIKQEEDSKNFYLLPGEEYNGQKIQVFLHAEKKKVEKKYFLLISGMLIFSNDIEHLKRCYDRFKESKADGLVVPPIYQQLGNEAVVKVYVDPTKFKIDLSKKHPLEKRFPIMQRFFERIRSSILDTKTLAASLSVDKGLYVKVIRERNEGSPALLPPLSYPPQIIDKRTIIFTTFPIPYDLVWCGVKAKEAQRDSKHWRKVEAGLNQMFDWMSFEDDVISNIGPQTCLLVNLPPTTSTPCTIPCVTVMVQLNPNINWVDALKTLWDFILKNPKIARHLKPTPHPLEGGMIVAMNLHNTPLDKLVDPVQAIVPGWLLLSSHGPELKNLLGILKSPVAPGQDSLYAHISFPSLAELLRINTDFLVKEAAKKNDTMAPKKLELLYSLLNSFQVSTVRVKSQAEFEVLEIAIPLNQNK